MGTHESLGALTLCRVWHDNAGQGEQASWFLDKIIVEDLGGNDRFYFLSSAWLAVDEGDGRIDRIIPVAAEDEIKGFSHLFFSKARKDLTDGHLWLSIASRPTKSSFTRLQRLTCAIVLLFSTMIVNAMFYKEEDFENDIGFSIGPISISVSTLLLSIYGTLLVIPPNTIIIMLFRKSKPKGWSDSDEEDVDSSKIVTKTQETKKKRFWQAKYPLPHWAIYIAWAMSICIIIVCGLFIIFYSLDWGKDKSERWLSSILLSFVQSACVVQPLKVVLMAMLISLIFRKLDELDEDQSPRSTAAEPATDEVMYDDDMLNSMVENSVPDASPTPQSQFQLERARNKRMHEKKMWGIIREVVFYFLFLVLVSFIAWGPADDRVFHMNKHINTMLRIKADGEKRVTLDDVKSGFDFWEFMIQTTVPVLYHAMEYNGEMATLYDRQFLNDMYTFRVGSVRLRQNRIMQAKCTISPTMQRHSIECNVPYNMFDEDTRNFTTGWYEDRNGSAALETRFMLSWKYLSTLKLKGIPTIGKFATYSGGGYVADLGVSEYHAMLQLNALKEHSWVDHYTRSVFLEFTTYNPNINLFAYINYLFEFPSTGGVIPLTRVSSFQVYSAHDGIGKVVLVAQIIYVLVIVVFIVKEGLNMRRQGCKPYMHEPWNWMEIVVIVVSLVALAMFALREVFGRMVMDSLKQNREAFTNYSALAYYDENLTYVVGILVFIANIKFLRLLRFNKHVRTFISTLKTCRHELMYFFITLFILLMGFSLWAFLSFGTTLYGFSTFGLVIQTLFSYMLGKMDYIMELDIADRYLGQPFFVLYVFLIFFICMNMFVGIIGTAYAKVLIMEGDTDDSDVLIVDFIVNKVRTFIGLKNQTKPGMYPDQEDPLDVLHSRIDRFDELITQMYAKSSHHHTRPRKLPNEISAKPLL